MGKGAKYYSEVELDKERKVTVRFGNRELSMAWPEHGKIGRQLNWFEL